MSGSKLKDRSLYLPITTYRIQFHAGFNLKDFREILPYLEALGVSTVYASPFFGSRIGSTHNYDVTDPLRIDKEIGTLEEFREITDWMKAHQMGWLQDIVPNHMAFDFHNEWLMDALQQGDFSSYASFFDINWDYPDPDWKNKVMVPFLGAPLDEILRKEELKVELTPKGFIARYYENKYPLNHKVYEELLDNISGRSWKTQEKGDRWHKAKTQLYERYQEDEWFKDQVDQAVQSLNREPEQLKRLLNDQFFILQPWQVSEEKINYRRFFTINDLICLSMENPWVFQHYHRFIHQLIEEGRVQGLRIDHIDGLFDPKGYLQALRELVGEEVYLVVEKILEWEEKCPDNWPIQGTTGYEFLAQVNQFFTNPEHEKAFSELYKEESGEHRAYDKIVFENKYFILTDKMGGELDNLLLLAKNSGLIGEEEKWKEALAVFMAAFPVYRIYPEKLPLPEKELKWVREAEQTALRFRPELSEQLRQITAWFTSPNNHPDDDKRLFFLQRSQQFTGPLAAKGVEDTTFYQYYRLIAHNEVGDTPAVFGMDVKAFHQKMLERLKYEPLALNTTATHDTKRGEDARMRINVLSEIPELWKQNVREWKKHNELFKSEVNGKSCPDGNEEYFIYQALVGAMPFDFLPNEGFLLRMDEFLVKALREGKVNSDWSAPNEAYEQGVKDFVHKILHSELFMDRFIVFMHKVIHFGKCYSLGQCLIKLTAPGTPDIYQGCELWDLSLVDPDNRRPVDYKQRDYMLQEIKSAKRDKDFRMSLLKKSDDGHVKLYLIYYTLKNRLRYPEAFQEGDYIPLQVTDDYQENVLAFARVRGKFWFITVVPRKLNTMTNKAVWPLHDIWSKAALHLPEGAPHQWTNCFSGAKIHGDGLIPLADILNDFPVALLKCST